MNEELEIQRLQTLIWKMKNPKKISKHRKDWKEKHPEQYKELMSSSNHKSYLKRKIITSFKDYVEERDRLFKLQDRNKETANINWASLSLGGEIGEFLNEVKKINRDDKGVITDKRLALMQDELGDIIWYWLFVCDILKLKFEDVLENNMIKLKKRYGIK